MLTCHFCTAHHTMTHLQATGQHKTRQASHILQVYYPFASTHMVNTQLLRVQNVHTKYRKYFHGFLNLRLLSFARIPRKSMYREYYHVYSIHFNHFTLSIWSVTLVQIYQTGIFPTSKQRSSKTFQDKARQKI